jgi:hypothetical protein
LNQTLQAKSFQKHLSQSPLSRPAVARFNEIDHHPRLTQSGEFLIPERTLYRRKPNADQSSYSATPEHLIGSSADRIKTGNPMLGARRLCKGLPELRNVL